MNNQRNDIKKIRLNRSNTIVEIKIGRSRSSLSGKLSIRPTRSVFRAKSVKKTLAMPGAAAVSTLRNLIS
jgi:hypothetical protein